MALAFSGLRLLSLIRRQ